MFMVQGCSFIIYGVWKVEMFRISILWHSYIYIYVVFDFCISPAWRIYFQMHFMILHMSVHCVLMYKHCMHMNWRQNLNDIQDLEGLNAWWQILWDKPFMSAQWIHNQSTFHIINYHISLHFLYCVLKLYKIHFMRYFLNHTLYALKI